MTRLSIAAATGTHAPQQYAATLASLPVSFGPAEPDNLERIVLEGAPGWAAIAADSIAAGTKGIVVSSPVADDPAEVERLLDATELYGASVELAEEFAGDPGIALHAEELALHASAYGLLTVTERRETVGAVDAALSVLRTARAFGLPAELDRITARPSSVAVSGRSGGARIDGIVARHDGPRQQRVLGLGFSRTLDAELLGSGNARPARIALVTGLGTTLLTSVSESPERAAWVRLHRAVTTADATNAGLRSFADDLSTAAAV